MNATSCRECCTNPATFAAWLTLPSGSFERVTICADHAPLYDNATALIVCAGCGSLADPLQAFPGDRCLDCYERDMTHAPMPTAADIRRMWGIA